MAKRSLRSTFLAKAGQLKQEWFHVDASGKTLGRLAARIAPVLMGKHKPTYTPHIDTGDFVVVTNADKVRVTGRKPDQMSYERYSYYPSGRKVIPFKAMMQRHPDRILREAVRRMLPKSALGKSLIKKLKLYASNTHPHQAQQPVELK